MQYLCIAANITAMNRFDDRSVAQCLALRKYKKRITTTQVVLFVVIGVIYFSIFQWDDDLDLVQDLIWPTVILIIYLCSFIRPLIPLSLLSLLAIYPTFTFFRVFVNSMPKLQFTDGFMFLVVLLSNIFLMRGLVNAIKRYSLKRDMKCKNIAEMNVIN
jgi:hypothetical protein